MAKENSVYQRRRAPTTAELQQIPWLALLQDDERLQIVPQLVVIVGTAFVSAGGAAFTPVQAPAL